MAVKENSTAIFNRCHHEKFGYHITVEWDDPEKRESLSLSEISWVNPEKELAGQIDLISDFPLLVDDAPFWLLVFTYCTGDSFEHYPRAEIVYADIFEYREDAEKLQGNLLEIKDDARLFPENGYLPYSNGLIGKSCVLDISYLNNIFEQIDGVFLLEITKEKIGKQDYGD